MIFSGMMHPFLSIQKKESKWQRGKRKRRDSRERENTNSLFTHL
jgi:hypothetical protein